MSHANSIVLSLWNTNSSLRISGIYRPDDTVACLDFKRLSSREVESFVTKTRSASDVLTEDPTNQSYLFVAPVDGPHGTKINAGETDEGSEGFVAVSQGQPSNLLWLAFFDFSNPFDRATLRVIDHDHFAVRTNLGADWQFSLNDPTHIVVTMGEYGWRADRPDSGLGW